MARFCVSAACREVGFGGVVVYMACFCAEGFTFGTEIAIVDGCFGCRPVVVPVSGFQSEEGVDRKTNLCSARSVRANRRSSPSARRSRSATGSRARIPGLGGPGKGGKIENTWGLRSAPRCGAWLKAYSLKAECGTYGIAGFFHGPCKT